MLIIDNSSIVIEIWRDYVQCMLQIACDHTRLKFQCGKGCDPTRRETGNDSVTYVLYCAFKRSQVMEIRQNAKFETLEKISWIY